MCQKCNQNTCNGCTQEFHICNTCPQEEPCGCEVKDLSTDCVVYTGDDIKCNDVIVVPKNTILSNALQLIVSWTCTRLSQVQDRFKIVNTGIGASIYSGDTLLGEKKLRKLKSTDGSVTITQGTDDIDFSVEQTVIDGSETKVTAGTNVTVTGNGTIATPYVINATDTYTGNNVGVGTSIYKDTTEPTLNNFSHNFKKLKSSDSSVTIAGGVNDIDLSVSPTSIVNGVTTTVTGNGTSSNPYIIEAATTGSSQSLIGSSGGTFILPSSFNNSSVLISTSNGLPLTIIIPTGLPVYFFCSFILEDNFDVTFTAGSGVTLYNPIGYKIKGKGYNVAIEQKGSSNLYYLMGNTKV